MASVVTGLLHFFAGIPVGWSALMAFLVWPIVGTIITSDDDLPGGWSDPGANKIPEWETPVFWGRLSGGCAAVSISLCCSSSICLAMASFADFRLSDFLRHICLSFVPTSGNLSD